MNKTLQTLFALILLQGTVLAQNVDIPDIFFKSALLGHNPTVDTNDDGEIQFSEAQAIDTLIFVTKAIKSTTGIEAFINLKSLSLRFNSMDSIDLSSNVLLENLVIEYSGLTTLEVSHLTNLKRLNFSGMSITKIDLSHNTALESLTTNWGGITVIDVRNNPNLTYLFCRDNDDLISIKANNGNNSNFTTFASQVNVHLRCIQVDDVAYAEANWTSVGDNTSFSTDCQVIFSDPNFKSAILSHSPAIDTNTDGIIQASEAEAFTGMLQLDNEGISGTLGIEAFTNITGLNIENNEVQYLDVQQSVGLTSLSCQNNNLIMLNVENGNNTSFTQFQAQGNPNLGCIRVDDAAYATANWTSIDPTSSFNEYCGSSVINFPDANFKNQLLTLHNIDINDDDEISLYEANRYDLQLYMEDASLTDLTGIVAFRNINGLHVYDNNLSSLDLSRNQLLTDIRVENNQLTSLNISHLTELEKLNIEHNDIDDLDISNNTKIEILRLGHTMVENLDVSHLTDLFLLQCDSTYLNSLIINNGDNLGISTFSALHNPDLYCIQVDVPSHFENSTTFQYDPQVSFTTTCDYMRPVFTSDASVNFDEGGLAVAYTATTNEMVTFFLDSMRDESLFSIDNGNEISFINVPDFETPLDEDADNDYVIEVIAQDVDGNKATLAVTITVTDIDDRVRWTGSISNDWALAGNWINGFPSKLENIFIPDTANDPVVTDFAVMNDVEIETGVIVTVESGAAFAILGTVTGKGETTIKRNTNANFGYSIIGSPIRKAGVADLGADVIYEYDGTSYNVPIKTMIPGKGYFAAFNDIAPEASFTGTPNTGSISITLSEAGDMFNAVANPYAAAIYRSEFIANNSEVIDGNIWLWDDGGSNIGGNRGGDYIAINDVGSTSTVDLGDGVAGIQTAASFTDDIGSVQGFLVLAVKSEDLIFTPTMQIAKSGRNDDASYFRTAPIQKVRLSLSGNGLYNDILIAFAEGATEGKDYGLDAEKFTGNDLMSFYSTQPEQKYAIQTLPRVESQERVVALGMDLGASEIYKIEAQEMENMNGLEVVLYDRLTDQKTVLSENIGYSFSAEAGSISDRFSLLFSPQRVLSLEDIATLKLYGDTQKLFVNSAPPGIQQVTIYDLSGKVQFDKEVLFREGQASLNVDLHSDKVYILRVSDQAIKFTLK